MDPPAAPLAGGDVVFIGDDDEDLLLEDEWQTDSTTLSDATLHAGQIQLQLRLCFAAAVALPVLAVLITMAWRRFGEAIYAHSARQPAGTGDGDKKQK